MEFLIRSDCPTTAHRKHWRFCVGSGHATLALRTDYTRQLKFIHDTLGIERVRFHGIFGDDMRTCTDFSEIIPFPVKERILEYNFNNCGVAYDNVLDAGMKPFVELSFMPKNLMTRDPERVKEGGFFYKPLIVPPEDEEAWKNYIQAFVRFLIHRYGAEEVRSWYFEVWNEPDLPGAFWNGSRDEYFRLYEITARAIKEVNPAIPVGGPSTSGSKWVVSFLRYCSEHQVPVDFVSTHQYAGDPLGGVETQGDMDEAGGPGFDIEKLMASLAEGFSRALESMEEKTVLNSLRAAMADKSEIEDIPNDGLIRNSAVVKQQAQGLPVYYTEWNENAGFSSYTNDTRKVAAYDVKTALDISENVTGSSIWCFSDIFEEFHPFPEEFHGGFGILTQNGIPKPVYHGMKMLADAGDERLDLGADATLGEIGIAAFRKESEMEVLLFRQKMKNLDLPKEPARVRIELPEKPREVLLRTVDEEHGNPLRVWEEMGRPVSLNREEVETIRLRSAVEDAPCPFGWAGGVLELNAELGVNDLCFFRILF